MRGENAQPISETILWPPALVVGWHIWITIKR